ncbi:MAG: nuclear transport factor 2 family protein [Pseudomonadota bacterium]
MKIATQILFVALGLSACQPSDNMKAEWSAMQQTREAQLAEAGERWRRTYEAGDWETLRTLYTDDAVLMTQGTQKIEGADDIIAFLQRLTNAGASVGFQFDNEEVVLDGIYGPDDVGFVTAKYRMDIAFPGRDPTIVAGRSFLVYKWEDEQWKLWRDIDNLAPDAVPSDFVKEAME